VFRFAAPALVAGNTGLLKHASNVPRCALAIEDVFAEAGFPAGVFRTLMIESSRVAGVIADPRVQAVTLTGSEPAGRQVAATAGSHLKKTVLELGGSDPFIVLEDADLDLAVEQAVTSRFLNTGQSCIAAKRFIVVEPIADAFVEHFRAAVEALGTGDPLGEASRLGPMARTDLREELHRQVEESIAQGAEAVTGCLIPPGPGAFYPPSILDRVGPGMCAWSEELFGPVASIIRVADEAEAVRVANDTEFGLGGSVWTRDSDRGERIARQLECGCAFVNGLVKSDPRLPFGGIKHSGYGRELSILGMREFLNAKTLWIR
jgi:succinate-semialdehyde dehydrogenase/glutarate-semialdehyde dehydrogenase